MKGNFTVPLPPVIPPALVVPFLGPLNLTNDFSESQTSLKLATELLGRAATITHLYCVNEMAFQPSYHGVSDSALFDEIRTEAFAAASAEAYIYIRLNCIALAATKLLWLIGQMKSGIALELGSFCRDLGRQILLSTTPSECPIAIQLGQDLRPYFQNDNLLDAIELSWSAESKGLAAIVSNSMMERILELSLCEDTTTSTISCHQFQRVLSMADDQPLVLFYIRLWVARVQQTHIKKLLGCVARREIVGQLLVDYARLLCAFRQEAEFAGLLHLVGNLDQSALRDYLGNLQSSEERYPPRFARLEVKCTESELNKFGVELSSLLEKTVGEVYIAIVSDEPGVIQRKKQDVTAIAFYTERTLRPVKGWKHLETMEESGVIILEKKVPNGEQKFLCLIVEDRKEECELHAFPGIFFRRGDNLQFIALAVASARDSRFSLQEELRQIIAQLGRDIRPRITTGLSQ